ncbi:exopolyphosphatase [Corynebacterium atypicum]|uniref:Exopolyphosphatase n=1 Tax=Corynebacterium atypicum TaxID=191610 RepID=A0ABN4DEB0_9CORY|nr:FAD/NAD(P)-binding protein [Corynebacterium atypicum]AIG64577.1 exopolyphosphatase [Corynebacterium atypicum]
MNVPAIAIVGQGPRGVSVIERLAAFLRARNIQQPLDLHLIDTAEHGSGRIWDTDQTPLLCMNTLAGAVTLFTEPGSSVSAPVVEGPTLFEWIRLARGEKDAVAGAKAELAQAVPIPASVAERWGTELDRTAAHSHPSRGLYGAYLRWCLRVALAQLPDSVRVHQHHARVTAIETIGARDRLTLSTTTGGQKLVRTDATVLALGWQKPGPTDEEERLAAALAAHPGLSWVRPDNPIEQDLSKVRAGSHALVRGLGMGFFDCLTLLTAGRGGTFSQDPDARSGLTYHRSGNEPHVFVTSRRGYPFLPKSDYGQLPPKAHMPRLHRVIEELKGELTIDFGTQVWPAIVRDANEAYYRTYDRVHQGGLGGQLDALLEAIDAAGDGGADALVAVEEAAAGFVPAADVFRLSSWVAPLAGVEGTPDQVTERIAARLAKDIEAAQAASDSPVNADLWVISAARKPASILGAEGVYTAESRAGALSTFMALGQMAGSGPPLFRTRELLALIDAGVVTLLGAHPRLDVADGEFSITTQSCPQPVRAATLVDAWMHSPTIARPADPLAASLTAAGRWRQFANRTTDGRPLPTGSPEVNPKTRALIHPDGSPDPRLILIGIPTRRQLPDTTISPMPGTDPLMLQETDKAAAHALAVALGA